MLLLNKDCREVSGIKADLMLFDPPYGVTNMPWDKEFKNFWQTIRAISSAPVVMTSMHPFASKVICENMREFRYEMIWEKSKATGFLNAKKRPLVSHENILVFSKNTPPYYPVMNDGSAYNKGVRKNQDEQDIYGGYNAVEVKSNGGRYPRSVIYFRTAESEGKLHKTQKPLALMEYLVKMFSKEGQTVIDPFMGSGTTGLACKNLGRKFIGIEKDEAIFNVAKKRLENT